MWLVRFCITAPFAKGVGGHQAVESTSSAIIELALRSKLSTVVLWHQ